MPSARPPAPRSSSPASSALAPRGDISYLFDLELAHHLNHMLEGLLVFEAVRSRGGATHARTISLEGIIFCRYRACTHRGVIEPHRIYGDCKLLD